MVKVEAKTIYVYIEALDLVVHFIALRFNWSNSKAYEQLELLLLKALASNDFADEIEYLKLLTLMVIMLL